MRLYTSNFSIAAGNPKAVSIALFNPKWYTGKEYRKLAPTNELFKMKGLPPEEYKQKFFNQTLKKLDPRETIIALGDGAIMLCYEKASDFCHRQIVAEWINHELNIKVVELDKTMMLIVDSYANYSQYPQGLEKRKAKDYIMGKLNALPDTQKKDLDFKF